MPEGLNFRREEMSPEKLADLEARKRAIREGKPKKLAEAQEKQEERLYQKRIIPEGGTGPSVTHDQLVTEAKKIQEGEPETPLQQIIDRIISFRHGRGRLGNKPSKEGMNQ